jgi:hypothetical protein
MDGDKGWTGSSRLLPPFVVFGIPKRIPLGCIQQWYELGTRVNFSVKWNLTEGSTKNSVKYKNITPKSNKVDEDHDI